MSGNICSIKTVFNQIYIAVAVLQLLCFKSHVSAFHSTCRHHRQRIRKISPLGTTKSCNDVASASVSPVLTSNRRTVLDSMLWLLCCSPNLVLADDVGEQSTEQLGEELVSSLVYGKILGKGSYKTVYEVVSNKKDSLSLAMAVEKVSSKKEAQNALRGIRVADELEARLSSIEMEYYPFERIDDWWFQSSSLADYRAGKCVLATSSAPTASQSQTTPRKFMGKSQYLVALKPLYDIDFRTLQSSTPRMYENYESTQRRSTQDNMYPTPIAGLDLNDRNTAINLCFQACQAGARMHSAGLVHRDIKPANVMLCKGFPVLIDFGFSRFTNDGCIEEVGKLRGDPHYMLSRDAKAYRGCEQGDTYAMGKTLYEVIFGPSSSEGDLNGSRSSHLSVEKVEQIHQRNVQFWTLIENSEVSFNRSRFRLSQHHVSVIKDTVRGLCREQSPWSFQDAVCALQQEKS